MLSQSLEHITKVVHSELSLENLKRNIRKFLENDHRFSCTEMLRTPRQAARQFKEAGLQTEVVKLKADGKTAYLDCIMPQAWDIYDAGLEMLSPKKMIISDYSKCKLIVANRCKETPVGGITAELIHIDDIDKKDVRGKFVLGFRFPGKDKARAIEKKAAALVSAFNESPGISGEGVFWANGWSQSAGWYHCKEEPRITTFMIPHNEGRRLEKMLKAGKKIVLRGYVDSDTYNGHLETVTALIKGKSEQEFLLLAHMYEPFPSDNGDGCACVLELARVINKLIKEGRIPKPERSIRFMLSNEKYGSGQWFTSEARSKKIFAMTNVDSVCMSLKISKKPLMKSLSPVAIPHFMDIIFEQASEKYLAKYPRISYRGTYSDDMYMADPTIGVPISWIVAPHASHHNSVIDISTCDWKLLNDMLKTYASLVIDMVYMNRLSAKKRLPSMVKTLNKFTVEEHSKLLKRAKTMTTSQLTANFKFLSDWNKGRLETLSITGMDKGTIDKANKEVNNAARKTERKALLNNKTPITDGFRPELLELEKIIPIRLTRGFPFSLAKIPFKKRRANPLQSEAFTNDTDRFLGWMNGKRSLKNVIELFEMDVERTLKREELEKYLDYIAYLAKWKYLKLKTV